MVPGRSTPTAELPAFGGTLADAVNDAERRAIAAALEKTPDDLALRHPPLADCDRYDSLRGLHAAA